MNDPNVEDDVEILTELLRRGVTVHVLDPSPELVDELNAVIVREQAEGARRA